jgi:hypothetical protein
LRRPPVEGRQPWRELVCGAARDVRLALKDWPTCGLLVVAAGCFLLASVVGWIMVPFNDSYHFEMPRFWLQNQSALPFPCHNPRITTIAFLSEAIELPGFISFRNDKSVSVAAIAAGLLAVWTIYALARRLGASLNASVAAAAISVGYMTFASTLYTSAAEMFLSGVFFGGSVIFLMDAWSQQARNRAPAMELGFSVFLFVMGCGAKNPTTLVAPFYLFFLAVALRRLRGDAQVFRMQLVTIVAAGLLGLLCSGVAWNYGSNKIYFGEKGMPRLMKSTISHAYGPRDIWTRLCRGAVAIIYDTVWVPKSARDTYKRASELTVKALGGKSSLAEDDNYFLFKPDPMKGLGPLGIVFFVPALIAGCAQSVRASRARSGSVNVATLTALSIASFVMCHVILRWQSIGMVRLMFPFVIAGAPLAALLFEKRVIRVCALGLLMVVSAVFFVYLSGVVSRRLDRSDGAFFKAIAKLQNQHATLLHYRWDDKPAREVIRREDFNLHEVFAIVLAGFRQPCTIGFIGNENSECLYLFGQQAQNRIVPLVDAREEEQIMEAPTAEIDYVVAADRFERAKTWAETHGFEQIFTCSDEKGEVALAFKNKMRTAVSR